MTDEGLLRAGFASIGRTFRGSIVENARRFRLTGPAYDSMPAEQDGFFDIESARQLAGPLAALQDDGVREVGIIGATQVLKSVAGNVWLPYVMEHDPGDALVAFENDDKALSFADRRLMPTIRAHPTLFARIEQETDSRHDVTKTKIVSNSMSLTVGGLNDTTVSTFSYRYVWVSESWQHGRDGLLMKAIKRADRFPDICKILVESQAGLAGEDLHHWVQGCHQVPLTWACPYCDGRQTWEFSQLRLQGFVARPVRRAPPGELPLQVPPVAGSYAGMVFDPAEAVGADGTKRERSIDERARSARWECYWCGSQIKDVPEIRRAIARTYEQEYRVCGGALGEHALPGALPISPRAVVFYLPKEANVDNKFEASAKSYLVAKAAEESGNTQPLVDWYLSERAVFYEARMLLGRVKSIIGTAKFEGMVPNEAFRSCQVDCQKDPKLSQQLGREVTGHFWVVVDAVDKLGNRYELWRGYCTSWEEWIKKAQELKVPTRNVAVDGSHWFDDVKEQAARHRSMEDGTDRHGRPCKVWATWKVLRGSDAKSFKWEDGQWRAYRIKTEVVNVLDEKTGKWTAINVPVVEWSNFAVKNQLHLCLSGLPGKPKMVACAPERLSETTRKKEAEKDFSYESQLNSEILGEYRGQPKWLPVHKQNHYRDCKCEGIVLAMMKGLVGAVAPAEESAQEV